MIPTVPTNPHRTKHAGAGRVAPITPRRASGTDTNAPAMP
jgi:hypothetical protein